MNVHKGANLFLAPFTVKILFFSRFVPDTGDEFVRKLYFQDRKDTGFQNMKKFLKLEVVFVNCSRKCDSDWRSLEGF